MTFTDKLLWRLLYVALSTAALLHARQAKSADDTTLIQGYMDRPGAAGEVILPPGKFTVASLKPHPAMRYWAGSLHDDTVLRLADNAGPDTRIAVFSHSSETDRRLTVAHLKFDMNKSNQGWDGRSFTHEHQCAVLFTADRAKAGRLIVDLHDLKGWDSAGDIVYVEHGVTANILRLHAQDCFRNGITITGHKSFVTVTDCDLINTKFDIEPNQDHFYTEVNVNGLRCTSLDLALTAGSKFTGNEIKHLGGIFYLKASPLAEYAIENSTFICNLKPRIEIRQAGRGRFSHCKFSTPVGAAKLSNVINILWHNKTLNDSKDQSLLFDYCIVDGSAYLGIDVGIDDPANRNQFAFTNGKIVGVDRGAAPQKGKFGLPWILTNSTGPDGMPLK